MRFHIPFFLCAQKTSRYILITAFMLAYLPAHALEIRGEPTSENEIATLPAVCKLILIEQPGIHHVVGQRTHPELFDRPEYRMAKGNIHLHHYCWSLIHKLKYFRANGTHQKNHRFSQFMGDIDYVIQYSDKTWQFFHVMLLEQADMLVYRREFPQAILKIQEALKYSSNFEKAFVLLYDAYLGMGNKQKAIQAVQEGLTSNPRSKPLRRRLQEQGLPLPPLPSDEPKIDSALKNITESTTINPTGPIDQADSKGNIHGPVEAPSSVENRIEQKPAENPNIGTPHNPYCRFCP